MREEVTLLLALQAKDQEQADLQLQVNRLEAQKAQVKHTLEDEQAAVEALRQALRQLEQESRLKNLEVDDLDMQTRTYQKRLDEGIISLKEMEALHTKITHQREQISEMEDEALALMDDIEGTQVQLEAAEARLIAREKELVASCQVIDAQIAGLRQQITGALKERARIASQLRPHLLNQYEKLHAEYSDPVVAITNGTCSGCKLRVSGNTVARARSSVDIITCENCSRILYVQ